MNFSQSFISALFILSILQPHTLLATEEIQNPVEKSSRTHYVAAVVEYEPEGTPWDSTPEELIAKNVNNYMKFIEEASNLNADIIVFPEYGLTTLGIPKNRDDAKPYLLSIPDIDVNPCDSKLGSEDIRRLSCSAKAGNIYLVVNVGEVLQCLPIDTNCPDDGRFQFNTNVAFDRNGTIVAKYEKGHLYFEDQFNKPNPIKLSTFVTDFDVEFGLFVCFDIIFFDPAVPLAERGVNNFIFPTAWVDELPFLMAIQSQAAWAYNLNVNLLASGYHQPLGGQLGSGIYSGRYGAINYTFDPDSGSKILIAEVPIKPYEIDFKLNRANLNKIIKGPSETYHSFLREDLQNYTTKILKLTEYPTIEKACTENGFCCEVWYQVNTLLNSTSTENYRLVAFNGTRTVAAKTDQYDWQVCGVIRCLNETLESCSENDKTSSHTSLSTFNSFKLNSKFNLYGDSDIFLPGITALDVQFNLISYDNFNVESNVQNNFMQISSNSLRSVNIKTIAMIKKLYFSGNN